MTDTEFTAKERSRFRKLLEVANSTTFSGEREAALTAATRLAAAHGLSLREAAGMSDIDSQASNPVRSRHRPRASAAYPADFGAAGADAMGRWWTRPDRAAPAGDAAGHRTEHERVAAEKRRRDEALADALRRGLDADIRAEEARRAARKSSYVRPAKRGSWRSRPEFIRVLLSETEMTAKEIAAAAGVSVYEVFKVKLLMRNEAKAS